MELRHLRYFVAVADGLSFRGAAERLRVSQPALSKQIRDLEEELKARLFDRDTTHVRLTDSGAVLLAEARRLLSGADRLSGLVRDASDGRRGALTIGNVGSVSAGFLPATLTAFHAKYPEVDVSLAEMRFQEQRAALAAGRIQVGIVGGSTPPEIDELERVLVLRSPIRVFVGRRHALARRAKISITDLAAEKLLAVMADPGASEHFELVRSVFTARGLKPPAVNKVDSLESLFALIAANHGVSVLPTFFGAQRGLDLLAKPLKEPAIDRDFSLWGVRRRDGTSQLAKNFVEVLQAEAQRIGGRPRHRSSQPRV